ncbi:MAG: glycosyltransferase family 39 protein [Ignavibacteria bacterium]|nr:glycosyltransferase family 39 protein [Ignavibacteria bacterium]
MVRKLLSILRSTAFLVLGVLILALIAPHFLDPYQMRFLTFTTIEGESVLDIDLFLFPLDVHISAQSLGIGALIICVFVMWSRGFRRCLSSLKQNTKTFFAGVIAIAVLIISLIPTVTDNVGEALHVVVYLVFGSVGTALMLAGVAPIVRPLLENGAFGLWVDRGYGNLKRRFLATKTFYFLGALFLLEFGLTNLLSFSVFEHLPHVQDGVAQVFQGKIFALGRLTAPSPPYPEFFEISTMITDGGWYSQYPPGHSFLLMFGALAGAVWVINPLFGSATVVLTYYLAKELYGEATGRVSAILVFLSPFVLFMSSEYMNHTTSLFFFMLFAFAFTKTVRTGKPKFGVIAGAALGWLFNIRPFTAVALALPFIVYGLFASGKRPQTLKVPALLGVATFLLFGAALLSFNWLTNGDPFLFGYQVLYSTTVEPGFGSSAWGNPHTPLRGLLQTLNNFNGLNKFLFEWPIPSLFFVSLLFSTGGHNRWDVLLLLSALSLAGFHFFYWFQHWCFGPRYLFEASGILVILTARGMLLAPRLFRDVLGYRCSVDRAHAGILATVAFLFAFGFVSNLPALSKFYGDRYWNVSGELLKTVEERGIRHAVVFVMSNYESVFTANDPTLKGDVIFVRDLGQKNEEFLRSFPGYTPYLGGGHHLFKVR